MKRLTGKIHHGVVVYVGGDKPYVPAGFMRSDDVVKVLKRLAEFEDEAEKKEAGCSHCRNKDCDTCDNDYCGECSDKSAYIPHNYCKYCGKKLVTVELD